MASFLDILSSILIQLFFSVGIIFVFGYLISFCNKLFYKLTRNSGRTICYITGIVGTPIHELGHAIFCLIFGHKILEIKLYQLDSSDGVLGYVRHSYNKKNLYQKIGNFFIAIGPIVFGSAIFLLLLFLLMPNMFSSLILATQFSVSHNASVVDMFFNNTIDYIKIFFSQIADFRWWIILVFGISIALHMNLSKSDIASGVYGLGFVILLLSIINIIVGLISLSAMKSINNAFFYIGSLLFSTLLLSLFFSLCYLLLGVIIYFLRRVSKRN